MQPSQMIGGNCCRKKVFNIRILQSPDPDKPNGLVRTSGTEEGTNDPERNLYDCIDKGYYDIKYKIDKDNVGNVTVIYEWISDTLDGARDLSDNDED